MKKPIASCIVTAVPIYFLSPTSVAKPEYCGLSATAAIPQIRAIIIIAIIFVPKVKPMIKEHNPLIESIKILNSIFPNLSANIPPKKVVNEPNRNIKNVINEKNNAELSDDPNCM